MALNSDEPLYLPTDGGLAATHPEVPALPSVVGPATGNQDNTFHARLIPFACWKVDNIPFDFDSSFIKPEIARELESLKQLRARHPGAVLSIFGHTEPPSPGQPPTPSGPTRYKLHIRSTDQVYPVKLAEVCCDNANRYKELERVEENYPFFKPTGQWQLKAGDDIYLPLNWQEAPGWGKLCDKFQVDPVEHGASETPDRDEEYCKAISGRRAAAVYALLTRRTDIWEDIYSNGSKFTKATKGDRWGAPAIQAMLAALGREEETTPYEQSAGKRSELFQAYMDKLSGSGSGEDELKLNQEDFLARGGDTKGKGDFQGCGAFNPVLVLSEDQNQTLTADSRFEETAPNRRVTVLLFRPGSRVEPGYWPCPRVDEDTASCRRRFWSDADSRLASREERRENAKTHDTFACRFYDRLAQNSPCERRRSGSSRFQFFFALPPRAGGTGVLVIRSGSGQEIRRLPMESAVREEEGAYFDLDDLSPDSPLHFELHWQGRKLYLGMQADPGMFKQAAGMALAQAGQRGEPQGTA